MVMKYTTDKSIFSAKEVMDFILEQRTNTYSTSQQKNFAYRIDHYKEILNSDKFEWIFLTEERKILGLICFDKIANAILYLFVDKSFQDKGCGTELVQRIIDQVKTGKIITVKVLKSNTKAIRFYIKKGFDFMTEDSSKYTLSLMVNHENVKRSDFYTNDTSIFT